MTKTAAISFLLRVCDNALTLSRSCSLRAIELFHNQAEWTTDEERRFMQEIKRRLVAIDTLGGLDKVSDDTEV